VTECPFSLSKLSRLHPNSGFQFSFFGHVFRVLLSLDQTLGCACRNSFSSACQQRLAGSNGFTLKLRAIRFALLKIRQSDSDGSTRVYTWGLATLRQTANFGEDCQAAQSVGLP
jgi:hypothetical protein